MTERFSDTKIRRNATIRKNPAIPAFDWKTRIMKKYLLSSLCAAALVAGLTSCVKIDVNKLEGTWSEQYDPTVFAMDGSLQFTFDGNGSYQLQT